MNDPGKRRSTMPELVEVLSVAPDDSMVRLRCKQDWTLQNAKYYEMVMDQIVGTEPCDLRLEFSQVNYIDSLGVGVLVNLSNRLALASRVLTIEKASAGIRKIFEILKLDRLIQVT